MNPTDHTLQGRKPFVETEEILPERILFEDPMTGDWRENWFLDGEQATLTPTDNGLMFAAGTYQYPDPENRTQAQRERMSANHAVLWTKQEFEGDILITYECTRLDRSPYGVNILYLHARGVGDPPYVEDIHAWRDLRKSPGMGKYYTYMKALHISYNVGDHTTPSYIRARRYPKNESIGLKWGMTRLEPDYDDAGAKMMPGKPCLIEVEKRGARLTFRIFDGETRALLKECVWDTSKAHALMHPRDLAGGRIGLRQMSTKRNIYRNMKVIRL